MIAYMLDTNAINKIGCDDAFISKVIAAVKNGKITLYVTHIQVDEINNISNTNGDLKSKLIGFTEKYCKCIPTMGAVLGVSRLGACTFGKDDEMDAITNKKFKMIHDALIAVTAKTGMDFFVTDDDILRKKSREKFPLLGF